MNRIYIQRFSGCLSVQVELCFAHAYMAAFTRHMQALGARPGMLHICGPAPLAHIIITYVLCANKSSITVGLQRSVDKQSTMASGENSYQGGDSGIGVPYQESGAPMSTFRGREETLTALVSR